MDVLTFTDQLSGAGPLPFDLVTSGKFSFKNLKDKEFEDELFSKEKMTTKQKLIHQKEQNSNSLRFFLPFPAVF